jgi:protein-glucosylgalactosylhydroxylysine glucosidase
VADRIPIRAFSDGVTREHETYDGEIIKQADVNLLAFPLAFITDPEQIQKDLTFYTPLVTADGPAMTHGIFSVIASRLGDCVQAYQYFQEAYIPNKRGPFGVLAESQQSNNPYFATGAGAMLQAVLFGFGGLNIDAENSLVLREPCLPAAWRSLTITGVGKDKRTIFIGNE